jgi:purine-nucleoside phosphorylase
MAIHLHPTAALAERVLLPGDPGRALLLAQELLDQPKMFNHNRGLWGYTGAAADGEPLTIQSTGMGGPSAAIVVEELCDLGARRVVRVGTCGALDPSLSLGDLVSVSSALCADGTSRALSGSPSVSSSPSISVREGVRGVVVSTDLFYDPEPSRSDAWLSAGALAVDMETATVFAVAARRGIAAASVLAVTDVVGPPRVRIDDDGLVEASKRVGRAGAAALL